MILVGERLAARARRADRRRRRWRRATGARLAWVPRRAGERGALEAGCLPNLLPGGRPVADAAARVDVAAAWGVDHLPDDARPRHRRDPRRGRRRRARRPGRRRRRARRPARPGRRARGARRRPASWSASSSASRGHRARRRGASRSRRSTEKAGTFVNWEGRPRPFDAGAARRRRRCPTCGCWPASPRRSGTRWASAPSPTSAAELDGARPLGRRRAPSAPAAPEADGAPARRGRGSCWPPGSSCSTTGRMQDGEPRPCAATARTPVARVSAGDARRARRRPTATRSPADRGSITLPVEVADLPDGVVWVPANSHGQRPSRRRVGLRRDRVAVTAIEGATP